MMFSAIRKRMHLTPGTVIASVALIFAMSGGAYAAGRYVITSTKQISPKVLQELKGANGKPGAPGAQGATGATGATGSAGPGGLAGAKGENGAPGKNGREGEVGEPGSPWTAGGTLPVGSSEHGVWVLGSGGEASISFTIPLAAELDAAHVHYVKPGENIAGCTGGTLKAPTAESGNLCVYEAYVSEGANTAVAPIRSLENSENPGAGKSGAWLRVFLATEGYGVWVVTG